jgi:hypothetical protein
MQDSFLIPDATSWKFSAASRCRSSCFPQSVKHKQQQEEIEEEAMHTAHDHSGLWGRRSQHAAAQRSLDASCSHA